MHLAGRLSSTGEYYGRFAPPRKWLQWLGLSLATLVPVAIMAWWATESLAATALILAGILGVVQVCRDGLDRGLTAAFLLGELALFEAGLLRLVYPPQDLIYLMAGMDVNSLLFSYRLWGPRFCLGYPATWIRDKFHMNIDNAYAVLCVWVMVLVVIMSARILGIWGVESKRNRWAVRVSCAAFWAVTLCFMNGRLVDCFLGMVLVLWVQFRSLRMRRLGFAEIGVQALGIYLTMMSSGTMWVALTQCLIGDLAIMRSFRSWRSAFWLVLLAAGFAPYFNESEQKNLSFFGGKVTAMLAHGWGAVFRLDDILTALLLTIGAMTVGGLLFLARRGYQKKEAGFLLWFNIAVALMGGAFGYSTGTMGIPAAFFVTAGAVTGMVHRKPQHLHDLLSHYA